MSAMSGKDTKKVAGAAGWATKKSDSTSDTSSHNFQSPLNFWSALRRTDEDFKESASSLFFVRNELKRIESSGKSHVSDDEQEDDMNDRDGLPQRWIDFFCIVGLDDQQKTKLLNLSFMDQSDGKHNSHNHTIHCAPTLLDHYPSHHSDMEFPQQLPTFCFPTGCYALRRKRGKTHNIPDPYLCQLVLTSAAGNHLYLTTLSVYERMLWKEKPPTKRSTESPPEHDVWIPKCLVLLSHYPYYHAQSTILKELYYTVASGASPIPFERFVAHIVEGIQFPHCDSIVEWKTWTGPGANGERATFRLESPKHRLHSSRSTTLEPLFRTISLSNIMVIWATLLQEGKVVLQCSEQNVSLLTPICEALLQLLHPLEWKGIYVPVLPTNNDHNSMDILEAPVPYLLGLPANPIKGKLSHPVGVIWCDLDNDILHLGYNEDGTFVEKLPALPEKAAVNLKVQLEELADPLYLPSLDGIKGQMTTGDRSTLLDNALREPYAQRTRLFQEPSSQVFSRSYILSQSSKIPPRGKPLQTQDFVVLERAPNRYSDYCCCLADIFPIVQAEDNPTDLNYDDMGQTSQETERTGDTASNHVFASLARSTRHVQVHTDRLLAVWGQQEFATPSSHASKACIDRQFGKDTLKRQDQIAKQFFETANADFVLFDKVRTCFLQFFASILCRYEFYVNKTTNRLDVDEFLKSLRLPKLQMRLVKDMMTSQMFDSLLHDPKRRRMFAEELELQRQQRKHDAIGSQKMTSPMLVLTVPPPCGVGIQEGKTHCGDRRFPESLRPEDIIIKPPSASIWAFLFPDLPKADAYKNEQRNQAKSQQSSRSRPQTHRTRLLSILCVALLCSTLLPNTNAFSMRMVFPERTPECFRPPRTKLLYQSSTLAEEQYTPLNSTSSAPFIPLCCDLEYDFQQEVLSAKKFNADLHDVAFKQDPLHAHTLLKTMERLSLEDPTNSSLVQPDSLSYTTVIESWCQTKRTRRTSLVAEATSKLYGSTSNPDKIAASAAQDLLFSMERSQNLSPSPLNYLFVCQIWAEIEDPTGESMKRAEDILNAYKKMVEGAVDLPTTAYPRSSLAAFYAVLVDGWSRLVGKVDGALDRAEALLSELESNCSTVQKDVTNESVVQEMREKLAERHRDVSPFSIAYTSFIVGLSRSKRNDMGRRADAVLRRMIDKGVGPDMVVYTSVLNCWAKATSRAEREMASTRAVELLKENEDRYLSEGNYLLKPIQITYCQAIKAVGYSLDPAAPGIAEDILRRMYNLTESRVISVSPDVHIYNAVITALTTGGRRHEREHNARRAEKLLHDMIHRSRYEGELVEPNIFTYGRILRGWAESGAHDCGEQAQRVLDQLEKWYDVGNSRVRPNVVCYTTVIQAWGRGKAPPDVALQQVNLILSKLENLYMETGSESLRPNQITYIAAMDVYGRKFPDKAGSMSQALVDRMLQLHDIGIGYVKPTSIVFNSLINAWSKSPEENAAESAERVFQRMETEFAAGDTSAQPDEVSLCSVLNAWANHAKNGGALRAQQIMDYTNKVLTPEQRGFDHTVVSWNTLIKAWGRSRAADAVQRAERILVDLEMQYRKGKSKVKPDITTYSSVINCCAYYCGPTKGKSAAFDVARRTFDKIQKCRDLVANNIVYGTFFKAIGKLQKAGKHRDDMIEELFGECCQAGQVCTFSLAQVRSASTQKLFRRLVLIPCSLKDKDAGNIENIWRRLPPAWKRNVVY